MQLSRYIREKKISVGGDKEDRTPDLLLARQALSQLSYAPTNKLVGLDGLAPSTSRLSGVRSNHLSYKPISNPTRQETLQVNSELENILVRR